MTNRTKIILAIFLLAFIWFLTRTKSFEIRNGLVMPALAYQENVMNFGSYGEDAQIISAGCYVSNVQILTFDPQPALKGQLTANNGVVGADSDLIKLAHSKVVEKWGESEWEEFYELAMRESGFNPYAVNPYSGAYGIPQCLPVSKCLAIYPDFLTNPEHQLDWMVDYIRNRTEYGTPTRALQWHISYGWY